MKVRIEFWGLIGVVSKKGSAELLFVNGRPARVASDGSVIPEQFAIVSVAPQYIAPSNKRGASAATQDLQFNLYLMSGAETISIGGQKKGKLTIDQKLKALFPMSKLGSATGRIKGNLGEKQLAARTTLKNGTLTGMESDRDWILEPSRDNVGKIIEAMVLEYESSESTLEIGFGSKPPLVLQPVNDEIVLMMGVEPFEGAFDPASHDSDETPQQFDLYYQLSERKPSKPQRLKPAPTKTARAGSKKGKSQVRVMRPSGGYCGPPVAFEG